MLRNDTSVSVQPHMSLAFPIPTDLKLQIAKAQANLESSQSIILHGHEPYTYKGVSSFPQDVENNYRIRIGYLSADFRLKATSYLIHKMFALHDRDRFEVFCFTNVPILNLI